MAKIRYAVVQWREVELPEDTPVPRGRSRESQVNDLIKVLTDLGEIQRDGASLAAPLLAVSDGLELAIDNEYGYEDFILYEP